VPRFGPSGLQASYVTLTFWFDGLLGAVKKRKKKYYSKAAFKTLVIIFLEFRIFKRSLSRVTNVFRTSFAIRQILSFVNYITLNRWSLLAICPVFFPKTVQV
jgi:hypothetical protein